MRQAKSGRVPRGRGLLGLVALAALVPPAWAYVNGGDYHNTLRDYEKRLKAGGWGVSSAESVWGLPAVNQLVGRALQALPEKDAGRVPVEAKREVARLTEEAIQTARVNKQQVIKEGQAGLLRYRVGAYAFESYWETNYRGEGRRIHDRRTGLAPFVALKVVDAKGPDRPRP